MRRLYILMIIIGLISFASFLWKVEHIQLSSQKPKPQVEEKRKEIQAPSNETEETTSPKKEAEQWGTTNHPYLVTENRYVYLVLLKEKKFIALQDNQPVRKPKRTARSIYNRVRRLGLKNCVCHKLKGRRFLCIFSDLKNREVSLRFKCEMLVVGEKEEKTKYPKSLLDFPYRWQVAWMQIKENFDNYAKLYHPDFKSKYGNLSAWLNYRKANLSKIKYIDVVVEDPAIAKLPSTDYFVIFFHQIYRSNIKRIDSLKALVVLPTQQGLKIVREAELSYN